MSTDSQAQQAWWDSMTPEQREAYEDHIARDRAEREVYGHTLDTQPFDTLEQLQNFVYEHMKGSSISAYHDGICAYSLAHGSFRGYGAHYGPNSRYAWRYGLDGSITQEER